MGKKKVPVRKKAKAKARRVPKAPVRTPTDVARVLEITLHGARVWTPTQLKEAKAFLDTRIKKLGSAPYRAGLSDNHTEVCVVAKYD